MNLLREIRKQAGKTRDRLLYGARDRQLKVRAEAARDGWIRQAAAALPPLPPAPANVQTEVHTLSGEAQSTMGIWSSWSLLRHLPDARLVVHSDGTLSQATAAAWARAVPGMKVLDKAESEARMTARLAAFPHVLDWSRQYHFGLKIGGYYSVLDSDRIIEFDTDTLTFRRPAALLAALDGPERSMVWNRDLNYCYAYPAALLREVAGDLVQDLPDRLNAGYMASFRYTDADWALLDELVRRFAQDPRTDHLRYWMHQTLLALLAGSKQAGGAPLPSAYDVHNGATRSDAVMRHYVGNPGIRPRFYTEGVAEVIRNARADGGLPRDFCRAEVTGA